METLSARTSASTKISRPIEHSQATKRMIALRNSSKMITCLIKVIILMMKSRVSVTLMSTMMILTLVEIFSINRVAS